MLKVVSGALVAVAIAVVAVGWLQSPEPVTAAEAATAARGAYASAGLPKAQVDPRPTSGVYDTPQGGDRVAVWKTTTKISGGTVELWLTKSDAESVFLDDRTADGSAQLLTDKQFQKLADHYENPARQRKIRRNITLTVAALLIAALAVRLASVSPNLGRRPRTKPEPGRRRRRRAEPAPASRHESTPVVPRGPAVPRLSPHRTRPLRARGSA